MTRRSSSMRITYLPVRARCEPVLLILADSGVQFEYEEIPVTKWVRMKKTGQVTPATFPYSVLPILRVTGNISDDGEEFLLGETSAILSYPEETLAQPGAMLHKDLPLQARVRKQMITDASLFFSNRVWQLSMSKDWLAPPSRGKIWAIARRYLRNTETALGGLQKEMKVVPAETDQLTVLNVTVAAAITFITQVFPSAKLALTTPGAKFPLCGELWMAVMTRPRVIAYWDEHKVVKKAWTITEYGTAEWIAKEAAKYDSTELLAKL